jgi:hypothetical protein
MNDETNLLSQLTGHWYNFLKKENVKFPTGEIKKNQLMCLLDYYPNAVSQETMDQWIRQRGGRNDRQARHLAWNGWYIQTGNKKSKRMEINPDLANDELRLVSFQIPNPVWQKYHQNQVETELKYPGFGKIIRKYKGRGCFMCGTKTLDLVPYSKLKDDTNEFDIVPLCEECCEWCITNEVVLQISDNLVARPFVSNRKENVERSISAKKAAKTRIFNKEKRSASAKIGAATRWRNSGKAKTACDHTIKVNSVKKKGGPKEGKWSIVIRGPKVSGESRKKTLYCEPSLVHVLDKLSSYLGHYEIVDPETGIPGILPNSESGE